MTQGAATTTDAATQAGPLQYLDQVVATIVEVAHPQAIVLFGSAANGTAQWDSDLDLLVVKELANPADRWELLFQIKLAIMPIGVATDIILKTPAEVEVWRDAWVGATYYAVREGQLVYGQLRMGGADA